MKAEVTIRCTIKESEYIIEGLWVLAQRPLLKGKIEGTRLSSEDRTRIRVLANTLERKES